MDAKKQSSGRSNGKAESTPLEIRKCRYCKAKFEVNPQFPHKQFCKETHRKLYWRYGSQSIGKVAERIERDMRKLIASELAAVHARLDALEAKDGLRGAVDAARRFSRDVLNAGGGAGA